MTVTEPPRASDDQGLPKDLLDLEQRYVDALEACYYGRYLEPDTPWIEEVVKHMRPFLNWIVLFADKWREDEGVTDALERVAQWLHTRKFDKWDLVGRLPSSSSTALLEEGVAAGKAIILAKIKELIAELQLVGGSKVALPLAWNGTMTELCELFHQLVQAGWIRVPGTTAALARRMHAVFQKANGEAMDLVSLIQYMKPSAERALRKNVVFDIRKNPQRN